MTLLKAAGLVTERRRANRIKYSLVAARLATSVGSIQPVVFPAQVVVRHRREETASAGGKKVRCLPGVTATIRANRRDDDQHASAQGVASARGARPQSWRIGEVGRGCRLSLGAAFGLVSASSHGSDHLQSSPQAWASLSGGLLGLASGAAIGVVNGLVLTSLFSAGTFGQTGHERRWGAALAAGFTSAVASLAPFDWALDTNAPTWLYLCIPAAMATLAGVALSQIFEPIHAKARPRIQCLLAVVHRRTHTG
jgi:hypothetical protein